MPEGQPTTQERPTGRCQRDVRKSVPQLETSVRLSTDRKWAVTKTILTDICPA